MICKGISYTRILLLLNDILDKNQMEHVFFAVYDDDDNNGEFESLKRKFYQQLKGKFPEFQKEQTFDMKIIKGPSIEELISKAYIGLGSASFIRVDEVRFFPSMFLLIRENDDILYKLRFLQKIQYPLDQKRVYRMLDGKFFMDVFGRSDLRINDAVYHFCVLSIDSRANLWKWITLTKEHEYIDQCYMDALSGNGFRGKNRRTIKIYEMVDLYFGEKFVLYNDASFLLDDHQFNFFALFIRYIEALGKSLGLNVDQAQRLLQRINQKNMQYTNDDLDFTIEVSDVYTEFSDQLEIQYLSLLDIQRYSVDISGFYREDNEINETEPPETIEELFDRLYDFPKDDKQIILNAIHQDENGRSYQSLLDNAMQDAYESDSYLSLHIYIDPNYTKYRKRYEKWFKNDYVYQTLDQSAPEYVRNLWMTSAVLKNGARCDIFLDGYMVENFEKYISTINHQYFIDQIKIRKKLNLL